MSRAVTIEARASLGHLVHNWVFDAGDLPEDGVLVVVPEIPAEAQLDPVVADYVVDLLFTVVVDGSPVPLAGAWLAWPQGLDGEPVVWTPALGDTLAPHGVLGAEAQAFAEEMEVEGRLMAPITQANVRPAKPDPVVTDGWVDTGLYAAGGER